jgi:hypothetical protein
VNRSNSPVFLPVRRKNVLLLFLGFGANYQIRDLSETSFNHSKNITQQGVVQVRSILNLETISQQDTFIRPELLTTARRNSSCDPFTSYQAG